MSTSKHFVACCIRHWTRYGIEWLLDLQEQLGLGTRFYVNPESGDEMPVRDQPAFEWCVLVTNAEMIEAVARVSGISRLGPERMTRAWAPMRKVLLLLYLRRVLGLDYCILTGDDLVALGSLKVIADLSSSRMPFLVPDSAGSEDPSNELAVSHLLLDSGFSPDYWQSVKGAGYCSDLMGFDLRVLDRITGPMLDRICVSDFRWLDQALLVWLNTCSTDLVERFGRGGALHFLKYDDFRYPRKSIAYHACGINHKWCCLIVRAAVEFGGWPLWWALIKCIFFLPECKGKLTRFLSRCGWQINVMKYWQ